MPTSLYVLYGGLLTYFGGILMLSLAKKANGKDPLMSTKVLLAMGGTPDVVPTGNVH